MQHSGSKEGGGTEIDDLVARMLTCIIVVYLLHQHELSIKMLTNDILANCLFWGKKKHNFFQKKEYFVKKNFTFRNGILT